MLKVLLVMILAAAVLGIGVHLGKDRIEAAIHQGIDPGLPTKVEEHVWAPVSHGRPDARQRFRFATGQVTTKRCHVVLGTYSLHIDHQFRFEPTGGRIKAGCPGRTLRTSLAKADRAKVVDHGQRSRLVLTDSDDQVVLTLQG
jgi:hypothetical protein